MTQLKDLTVEEFTSPNLTYSKPMASLSELEQVMNQAGIRHIPVMENEAVVGLVSQRDLYVARCAEKSDELTARDIMVGQPFSVSLNTSIEKVALEMSERKIGSAVVEDENGKVYGIFTSTDALNALVEVVRGVHN